MSPISTSPVPSSSRSAHKCSFCRSPKGSRGSSAPTVTKGLDFFSTKLDIPLAKSPELYPFCGHCQECLRQIYEFHMEIQILEGKIRERVKDIQLVAFENPENRTDNEDGDDARFSALVLDRCKKFRMKSFTSQPDDKDTSNPTSPMPDPEYFPSSSDTDTSPSLIKSIKSEETSSSGVTGSNESKNLESVNATCLKDYMLSTPERVELKANRSGGSLTLKKPEPPPPSPANSGKSASLVVAVKPATPPRKEVWIKPRTPKTSGTFRSKARNSEQKKMKQQTLKGMSKNFPKETVDISTLNVRGGARSSGSVSSQESVYPVKRKSDEMDPESLHPSEAETTRISTVSSVQSTLEEDLEATNFNEPSSDNENDILPPSPVVLVKPATFKVPKPVMNQPKVEDLEDLDLTCYEPPSPDEDTSFLQPSEFLDITHIDAGLKQNGTTESNKKFCLNSPPRPYVSPVKISTPKIPSVSNAKKPFRQPNFNSTEELIKDFDKLPERPVVQNYGKAVRKKDERAKMTGWACDVCRKYYEGLESQMHPTELQKLKDNCSRHRAHHNIDRNDTPPGFWDTKVPSTAEAYEKGYIRIGVASPPLPKRRYDLLEDDL